MYLVPFFLSIPSLVASLSEPININGVPQQRLRNYHECTYSNPLESEEFERYVSEVLNEFHTPGISIAVVHNDKTWSKGFGYSDLSSRQKMTPRTLFFTGSTTKSFTAAIASKVVYSDESQYKDIDWTTRLSDLIRDDFVLQDEYATNRITFVDALSHRTGMPRHDVSWLNGDPSIREQVRRMRYLPLHNEMRVEWEYCNLLFTAVSHALETVVGSPMFEMLGNWLWKPLGMRETFFRLRDALEYAEDTKGAVSISQSYLWDNETKAYADVPFTDIPPENGACGIISNVLDYTHWIRQFLNPSEKGNPLESGAVADISAAYMPVPSGWRPYATHTYGLGLETATYRGHQFTGHQGAIAGYMAAMYWFPKHNWGFVALQNSYSFVTYAVQFKLMDDFLDSIGAQGGAYDMRAKARELEKEGAAELSEGRRGVYPDAPDLAVVRPALPLTEYEGTYHHPGYQNISLTISPSPSEGADALPGAPLPMSGVGLQRSYLNMTWTFHHVSGENWWVHYKNGPGFFMTDELLEAKFEVGVSGKVSGLGLQVEKALDELAWFEKLC